MDNTQVVIGPVRFSYANVWEPKKTPSGTMKYSCCILIPKDDKDNIQKIKDAINAAVSKGLEINKFTAPVAKSTKFKIPLRDGDAEYDSGERGPEYMHMFFLNSSSDNPPGIVDAGRAPIIDKAEFYSGCWGYAHVAFFPYNRAGNVGIGVGLNNLMKFKDDDRLDGRISADEAFKDFGGPAAPEGSDDPPFEPGAPANGELL